MKRIAIAIFGAALLLGLSACVGVVDQPYSAGYSYQYDGYGDGYLYPGGYYFLNGHYEAGYYYRHHNHYRGYYYPYGARIHYRTGHAGQSGHDAYRPHFSKKRGHQDSGVANTRFDSRHRVVDATDRHQRQRIDHSRKQVRRGSDFTRSDRRLRVKVRGLQAGVSHKTDLSRKVISHRSNRNRFEGAQKSFTGGWNDQRRGLSLHRGHNDHGRRLIGSDSRGRGGFEKRGRADRKGFCTGRSC